MYSPRQKAYAHQTKALELSVDKENFALFMEMGTGKTKIVLDTFGKHVDDGTLDGLLVIARSGVYRNWEKEIHDHMNEEFVENLVIGVWKGSANKRKKMIDIFFANWRKPRVLLMNVEAFSTVKDAAIVAQRFMQECRVLCAIDESTSIKGHNAERTRTIIKLAEYPTMRRIMTGTPNPNSPLDLYSQFEFLDPKILGFSSYYAFRGRYAVTRTQQVAPDTVKNGIRCKGRTAQIVVAYKNQEELARKIEPHRFRILKDECLDLPKKIYETRIVEFTKEQKRFYDDLKQFATTELSGGSHVTATSVITRLLRLHQVLCGHTRDEQNNLHIVPSNRLSVLLDTMEEANWDKIIVWSPFIYSIEEIVAKLKNIHGANSVVSYYGATSTDDRVTAVKRFQEDDTCKFFIGNQQTAGYGITLTAAKTMIFYSNNYDLEQRLQAEDRPHRIGLQHPISIVDLQTPESVDVKIIQALRKKLDLVSLINQDGYREWLV
jgi:SNF2 family DNA or RNA helicase